MAAVLLTAWKVLKSILLYLLHFL